jgi:hypothetical protein
MFRSASLSSRSSWGRSRAATCWVVFALSACGASHHAGTKHDQNTQPSGDADSGSNPSGHDGGQVEHDGGAAGETCAGFADKKCPDGQYCAFSPASMCGESDGTGTCRDIPQACDQLFKPVCGCDQTSYDNECLAAMHAVGVLHEGACEQPGNGCGGKNGTPCQNGEFCAYDQCAVFDDLGHCEKIPEGCGDIYQPVCGCDGMTYANSCEAAVAQETIAHEGACSGNGQDGGPQLPDAGNGSGKSCGGFAGLTCSQGEYCKYHPGGYCGGDDSSGVCTKIPRACPDDLAPVCGCDGKTYGNECDAAAHGVGVSHVGQC